MEEYFDNIKEEEEVEEIREEDLKVIYIYKVGVDEQGFRGRNIYRMLLATDCTYTWAEQWGEKPASNNKKEYMVPGEDMFEMRKEFSSDIELDCAQDNMCFSMQDCRDHIVALAWENIEQAEEYPEPVRVVIQFGEPLMQVEEMLLKRGIHTHFV